MLATQYQCCQHIRYTCGYTCRFTSFHRYCRPATEICWNFSHSAAFSDGIKTTCSHHGCIRATQFQQTICLFLPCFLKNKIHFACIKRVRNRSVAVTRVTVIPIQVYHLLGKMSLTRCLTYKISEHRTKLSRIFFIYSQGLALLFNSPDDCHTKTTEL